MNRIKKGWDIFKMSYKIAKETKTVWKLILSSLIFQLIIMFLLTVLFIFAAGDNFSWTKEDISLISKNITNVQLIIFSVIYTFTAIFIATFFNFAISYSILEFLKNKKDIKFSEAIEFAFSRLKDIAIWSLILSTVNIVLHVLNSIAERLGGIGELIMKLVNAIFGGAWNLITLFAIPVCIENEKLSAWEVIKKSKNIFISTWGETVVAGASVGMFAAALILGVGISFGIIIVITGAFIYIPLFVILFVLVVVMLTIFTSTMDKIYKIILYIYAENKTIPDVIENKDIIENGFVEKN